MIITEKVAGSQGEPPNVVEFPGMLIMKESNLSTKWVPHAMTMSGNGNMLYIHHANILPLYSYYVF